MPSPPPCGSAVPCTPLPSCQGTCPLLPSEDRLWLQGMPHPRVGQARDAREWPSEQPSAGDRQGVGEEIAASCPREQDNAEGRCDSWGPTLPTGVLCSASTLCSFLPPLPSPLLPPVLTTQINYWHLDPASGSAGGRGRQTEIDSLSQRRNPGQGSSHHLRGPHA